MAEKVLESTIEKYMVRRCREAGVFILKNTGMNGIPDRLIIHHGRCIFVELKRPGCKPRPLQVSVIEKLKDHGAEVLIVDTKDKVDAVIRDICDESKAVRPNRKKMLTIAEDVIAGRYGSTSEEIRNNLEKTGQQADLVFDFVDRLIKYKEDHKDE